MRGPQCVCSLRLPSVTAPALGDEGRGGCRVPAGHSCPLGHLEHLHPGGSTLSHLSGQTVEAQCTQDTLPLGPSLVTVTASQPGAVLQLRPCLVSTTPRSSIREPSLGSPPPLFQKTPSPGVHLHGGAPSPVATLWVPHLCCPRCWTFHANGLVQCVTSGAGVFHFAECLRSSSAL